MTRHRLSLPALAAAGLCAALCLAAEQGADYFSVKKAKTFVREEPEPKAKVLWTLWRFAPVEAVSYRGDWIRVSDFEEDVGWVKAADLTSDVPTVQVKAREGRIRKGPGAKEKIVWLLDRGYSLRVFAAKGDWLDVGDLDAVSGWIHSDEVWGFPPPNNPSEQ